MDGARSNRYKCCILCKQYCTKQMLQMTWNKNMTALISRSGIIRVQNRGINCDENNVLWMTINWTQHNPDLELYSNGIPIIKKP